MEQEGITKCVLRRATIVIYWYSFTALLSVKALEVWPNPDDSEIIMLIAINPNFIIIFSLNLRFVIVIAY